MDDIISLSNNLTRHIIWTTNIDEYISSNKKKLCNLLIDPTKFNKFGYIILKLFFCYTDDYINNYIAEEIQTIFSNINLDKLNGNIEYGLSIIERIRIHYNKNDVIFHKLNLSSIDVYLR